MVQKFKKRLYLVSSRIKELLFLYARTWYSGFQLTCVQDKTDQIKSSSIVLFSTLKNESLRIPFFLQYYRKLGVDHFVFVNNGSTDDFMNVVDRCDDVSVFYTEHSYKNSRFGMDWLNYLLHKYGKDKWCLTVDPDEFLIYPHMESRNLHALARWLESVKHYSMFTLMIDMYPEGEVNDAVLESGQSPFEVAPFFDETGYNQEYQHDYENLWVRGGVRRRIFYAHSPAQAPALNKLSFVKWNYRSFYISSMHMMIPRQRNHVVYADIPSGVLCHFKFIAQLKDKVAEELIAKQHFNDSDEYKSYSSLMGNNAQQLYLSSVSVPFKDWRQMIKLGLMKIGAWK